jgi:hypothetical protein
VKLRFDVSLRQHPGPAARCWSRCSSSCRHRAADKGQGFPTVPFRRAGHQAGFDSPDAFYTRHGSNLSGLKRWLYERVIRHSMNRNVARVRASKW